jgi:hypothetical protein
VVTQNDTCCNAGFALCSNDRNAATALGTSLQVLTFQFVYQQMIYCTDVAKAIGMYRLEQRIKISKCYTLVFWDSYIYSIVYNMQYGRKHNVYSLYL